LKKALFQTIFWVALAMAFFVFLWFEDGHSIALQYFSAYLMEWSLSIDNIFVFILIFTFFRVKPIYYARVLLIGIMIAIILRIIFITVGIALVTRFHLAALCLRRRPHLYGTYNVRYKTRRSDGHRGQRRLQVHETPAAAHQQRRRRKDAGDDRRETPLDDAFCRSRTAGHHRYRLCRRQHPGRLWDHPREDRHLYIEYLAVLGLRSLFFLLRGAVDQFSHLQQGIAVVLVFVGVKMLVEYFDVVIPVYVSLLVILFCISGGILYSLWVNKRNKEKNGV